MSRLKRILILGLLTGLLGVVADFTPFAVNFEENFGLYLLFQMRGVREAPKDVAIVSMDEAPTDVITLGIGQPRWSRSLYARLLEVLQKEKVAVVAFDMIFDRPRTEEEDDDFARAIADSGNVVLCEYLRQRNLGPAETNGKSGGELVLEGLIPPIPKLAGAAAGLAPFPLPKVPARVSQYWTFEAGLAARPSLPVVAYQIYALNTYREFARVLAKTDPEVARSLPPDGKEILRTHNAHQFVQQARGIFRHSPLLSESPAEMLIGPSPYTPSAGGDRTLKSLIGMYQSPDSPYLNFYGPAGTITHIPYRRLLDASEASPGSAGRPSLAGKAVFVGLSEKLSAEQKDCFPTVYSQADGTDLSGVEIAATAFANLLEDRSLRPVGNAVHLAILLGWGVVLGALCFLLPSAFAVLAAVCLGLGYLGFALFHFRADALWYPVATPLFAQMPLACACSICWRYAQTYKERHKLKNALSYYLPRDLVDRLASNTADHGLAGQTRYAVCLCTDASQYTMLSETMEPRELRSFMNRYFEAIFQPVDRCEGTIANVLGDSVLAMWAADVPDQERRVRACEAALGITEAVDRFNLSSGTRRLATRIGLHCGYVSLGNVGAKGRFEYRPVGDCVNTSSRIEGFNKQLGTQVLASREILERIDGFLAREVGEFLLSGKSQPIVIHELLSHMEDADSDRKDLCAVFAGGLTAFREGEWEISLRLFTECLKISENDGPSLFYAKRCRQMMEHRPDGLWNGVVCLEEK